MILQLIIDINCYDMASDPDKSNPHKRRRNCWEVMMCGREQGGKNIAEYGVCPAAADPSFDGINSGKSGGRICWAVAGTFCGGCTQGSFVDKAALLSRLRLLSNGSG